MYIDMHVCPRAGLLLRKRVKPYWGAGVAGEWSLVQGETSVAVAGTLPVWNFIGHLGPFHHLEHYVLKYGAQLGATIMSVAKLGRSLVCVRFRSLGFCYEIRNLSSG